MGNWRGESKLPLSSHCKRTILHWEEGIVAAITDDYFKNLHQNPMANSRQCSEPRDRHDFLISLFPEDYKSINLHACNLKV